MRTLVGRLSVAVAIALLADPAGALAQASDASVMSVDEVVARALADNPDLRAARAEVDAAGGRLRQAGLRPNPMLELGGQKAISPDSNLSVALTLPLDLNGRVDGRVGVATREVEMRRAQVAERERRLAADVRLKAGELLAARRNVEVADELLRINREALRLVGDRVREGAAPALDESLLLVEVNRLEAGRQMLESRVTVLALQLRALAGMEPDAPLTLRGELAGAAPGVSRAEAVTQALAGRPDLEVARADAAMARARIRKEEAEGRWDASVSVGYQRQDFGFDLRGVASNGTLQQIKDVFHYFGAGVTITLPVRNRNQGNVAAAVAETRAAERRQEFAVLVIRQEVEAALHAAGGGPAGARPLRARRARRGAPQPRRGSTHVGAGPRHVAGRDHRAAPPDRGGERLHGDAQAGVRRHRRDRAGSRRGRDATSGMTMPLADGEGGVGAERTNDGARVTVDEMTHDELPRSRWPRRLGRAALALALVSAGAAGGVLWSERRATSARSVTPGALTDTRAAMPATAPADTTTTPAGPPAAKVPSLEVGASEALEVSLTPDAIARIGLKTAVARSAPGGETLAVPASVVPNAYRDTKVNALVGGIVRSVSVELGSRVTAEQTLAVVSSQELAEAQMKYLSMQAMLQADHQKLRRTEKLVELGSASRQELEEVTAVHAAHTTEIAAARERLLILGLSREQVGRLTDAAQIVSDVVVAAPTGGMVTGRAVNPGQVVMAGQELFVVADVGTVWAVGEVYERDMAHVREGAEAEVVPAALPGTALRGRISYIDPRVDPVARTAKVRVEIANPREELRFGMYVTMRVAIGSGGPVVLVPRSAVQALGDTSVVYLPLPGGEGRFVERSVTLGSVVGDAVQVLKGLKPGDRVVTEGSFFLRAEAARLRHGG